MATQQQPAPGAARRRRDRSSNSLAALLVSLQGSKLVFELRSDVTVTGTLAWVDEHMK
jgi:hypothetical protein